MERMQPTLTFHTLLKERDADLYYKWWHSQYRESPELLFTAKERDILACVATQARKVTEIK